MLLTEEAGDSCAGDDDGYTPRYHPRSAIFFSYKKSVTVKIIRKCGPEPGRS